MSVAPPHQVLLFFCPSSFPTTHFLLAQPPQALSPSSDSIGPSATPCQHSVFVRARTCVCESVFVRVFCVFHVLVAPPLPPRHNHPSIDVDGRTVLLSAPPVPSTLPLRSPHPDISLLLIPPRHHFIIPHRTFAHTHIAHQIDAHDITRATPQWARFLSNTFARPPAHRLLLCFFCSAPFRPSLSAGRDQFVVVVFVSLNCESSTSGLCCSQDFSVSFTSMSGTKIGEPRKG